MDAAPLIDEELAGFLQSGISMHAASVGPGSVAQIARAAGKLPAVGIGLVDRGPGGR